MLLITILLFFYGCSDDPFKGMSEDEKIKRYEEIKIKLLQRWTCNYFIEEVYEYKTDRDKRKLNVEKKYFFDYPLHFYGARDYQENLTNKMLRDANVPSKFWDTSKIEIFDIDDLPCQEKIQERNFLKKELEKLKNRD